jgi:hypothetical protein
MGWNSYGLDQIAQRLVLDARQRNVDSLNQGYKMRMSIAYGLERFWGEHLRLQRREAHNAEYWKETWDALVNVMQKTDITLPNDAVIVEDIAAIRAMSERLWELDIHTQRVSLAILSQLCDCIVWWTQRYK